MEGGIECRLDWNMATLTVVSGEDEQYWGEGPAVLESGFGTWESGG